MTDVDTIVERLALAFAERRLRSECVLIAVKDLAAAARKLGQPANMKMRRVLLVGAIEAGLLAREGEK
jgi:hypothetical protein